MKFHGGKFWFTAAELADLKLPGLPATKRKVNERAAKECWALQADSEGMPLARPRQARGGGLEYHLSVLPSATRTALVRRGIAIECQPAADSSPIGQSALWSWYEAQSDKVKAEAERRARIIGQIDLMIDTGVLPSNAVPAVAIGEKIGASTLWSWLSLVDGVAPSDRLPHLAPRRKGGGRTVEVDEELWSILVSDYLRPSRPTFASCYSRTEDIAAERGLSLPSEKTLKRRLEREIDGRLIVARRYGTDALKLTIPQQRRTVAHMHAMEWVNIDGHKFDVFVRRKGARPGDKPIRPVMVALQDVFSRKILAWRIGESESAVLTRLAFADLFRDYGIPGHCLLDNGRAFASKWITGGAPTRFRFKIKDDEPTGLLTALGVKTRWAKPFHGQAKPIERAFRVLADVVARAPDTEGAWTGNHVDAKPENYNEKALDWDVFVALVDRVITKHNAKRGRRTETANGRSYDEVFAASYAVSEIRKASQEQLRLALLAGEQVRTHRQSGEIALVGNRYWAPELSQIAGKPVTIRFDPDNLHSEIHVYSQSGEFLVTAALVADTGFDNIGAARARAKADRDIVKLARELEKQQELRDAAEIAALQPGAIEPDRPEPKIIRPVRAAHRNGAAAAVQQEPAPNFMNRFAASVSPLRLVD
ncbi:transposase domain-containing protein [Sphingopyxis sp. GW247-27LB]|uniref:transposase domain-containing protein n=1 Tax=Sphingopyxis sp. GW247-27LB TaxID=2012632 RepID=UPI000BA724A0|nr:transposase domain-containing protein [Sphingopyxis sp. GW247-27LB]PAL25504.1 transposase [Sphingopyxis sp. GW247-27LB]